MGGRGKFGTDRRESLMGDWEMKEGEEEGENLLELECLEDEDEEEEE